MTNASLDTGAGATPPSNGGDPGAGAWAASMAVLAAALLLNRADPGRKAPAASVRGLDA